MIYTITLHEVKGALANSKSWYSMAALFSLMAIIFNWLMNSYLQGKVVYTQTGVTEAVIHPFFAWFALTGLILTPAITSQFLCAEKTRGTMLNYHIAKVPLLKLLAGKILSLMILLAMCMIFISIIPMTIVLSGNLDFGHFASSVVGVYLMLSVAFALGLLISSFTVSVLRSNFLVFLGLIAYVLFEWAAHFTGFAQVLQRYALLKPLKSFLAGIIAPAHVIYYLAAIGLCIVISSWRLEYGRYHD